jgi:hypothetical protein
VEKPSPFFFLLPFFFSWVCTSAVFAAGELDLNHVLYPHESGVKVRNFRRDAILSFTVQSHRSLAARKAVLVDQGVCTWKIFFLSGFLRRLGLLLPVSGAQRWSFFSIFFKREIEKQAEGKKK